MARSAAKSSACLVISVVLAAMAGEAFGGEIIYVDGAAAGANDGTSWANAHYYLQDALAVASDGDEIRVGQGVYIPDKGGDSTPGDRKATFRFISGVTIRGGYAGFGEPDPNARNIGEYETVLSGDLADDDVGFANNDENCYSVVHGNATDATAVLDGFTITGGNADGHGSGEFLAYFGGGIYCLGGPTVIDCRITGNSAAYRGGGMYNHLGSVTVTGCIFTDNIAGTDGGAMFNHHYGPTLTNCIFAGNFAAGRGGGIAGDNLYLRDLIMTNCTLAGNEAGETGGGLFQFDDSDLYLTNCILWGNFAYDGPEIGITGHIDVFIRYCCLLGGLADIFADASSEAHWDSSNTDADPRFADELGGDYHLKSQADRWDPNDGRWTRDEVTSPCIDAGDPNSEWTAELWPHGKRINMGAFGGTPEASMSDSSLGNRADLDNSGSVNFGDLARVTEWWQAEGLLRVEDLNRDGIVNFFDILEFVEEWLWQEL